MIGSTCRHPGLAAMFRARNIGRAAIVRPAGDFFIPAAPSCRPQKRS